MKVLRQLILLALILGFTSCEIEEVALPDETTINAVDDGMDGINGITGATAVVNVLDNDTMNGAPATASTVTLSLLGETNAYISLNADGTIDVSAGTPAGEYNLNYEICDGTNEDSCTSASVTLFIFASETTAINAVEDYMDSINGTTGATAVVNVLDNDTIEGTAATTNAVTLSLLGATNEYITLNTDGTVDVAAGTPEGEYILNYEICDGTDEDTCASAPITLYVYNQEAAVIVAVGDGMDGINGTVGATAVVNVLDNDTVNGAPAMANSVTLSLLGAVNQYITLNADGTIDVAAGTPEGQYNLNYEICAAANEDNCTSASIMLYIFNQAAGVIVAVGDGMDGINGTTGATAVLNVLDNDTVDGGPAIANAVTLSLLGAVNQYITLNADGTVDVAAGTPEGQYNLNYEICAAANEDNCTSASITLYIFNQAAAVINAVDDGMDGINGTMGATAVVNVLDNDTIDGAPVMANAVTLSLLGAPSQYFTLNADGTIDVAMGTPTGEYNLNYEICAAANEDNCASASITLFVSD